MSVSAAVVVDVAVPESVPEEASVSVAAVEEVDDPSEEVDVDDEGSTTRRSCRRRRSR
ncbi:MAG: hypothetical protein H6710_00530 [Myxococcales bacterium]|nr:hypothetical protein [Myxococcales bacterium]